MRLVATTAAIAVLLTAIPAHAGAPINKLPACADSYLIYSPAALPRFRTAMLCLINAARKTQRLPALRRNAKLEAVAQSQSKGNGGHGKTLAEIGKRFEKKGYKPAAYNEAFSFLDDPAAPTPYGFLASMMANRTVPCSEILDPRFRDVGVGISKNSSGVFHTVALEFGLKQGAKQPSNDYSKAGSCPHKVPAPVFTTIPIQAGELPRAQGDTVTAGVICTAKTACVIESATLTLAHAKVSAALEAPVTIAAGQKGALSFHFDSAALQAETTSGDPSISLAFSVVKPAAYDDVFTGPLLAR